MQTVWKYPLNMDDRTALKLPPGAVPLSVQVQYDRPCLWVLLDPEARPSETRYFRMVGTGHPIEEPVKLFIGTFQLMEGSLIFHLFEVTE